MDRKVWRRRYLAATVLLFLVEAGIALFVHDVFVRPYVGDMLVVVLVYCFVRIFVPNGFAFLPAAVFLFAAAVEGLQAFHLVDVLGLEGNRLLSVVLGSTADWADVACYGVGCLLLAGWEILLWRRIQDGME